MREHSFRTIAETLLEIWYGVVLDPETRSIQSKKKDLGSFNLLVWHHLF